MPVSSNGFMAARHDEIMRKGYCPISVGGGMELRNRYRSEEEFNRVLQVVPSQ